jgi:hypothetical protein
MVDASRTNETPRDAYTEGARAVVFRTPLGSIELAGRSFGGILWARVECDCRARCCPMDGVDHHLEQRQAFGGILRPPPITTQS